MATQTATRPESDQTLEKKIQRLRELYATGPEAGKTALENLLRELTVVASSDEPETRMESAGRTGSRQGKVSELLFIAPFAPGGAARLRALLELRNGNFERHGPGWHRPRHAFRVPGQRHEAALRHCLRRRLGPLHRRLRDEDPRRNGRFFTALKAGQGFAARR